jgi:HD-GYP domain-containing protein (c-di-GMP phosphodiesterase class II)
MDFDSYKSPEAEQLLRSAASRYRLKPEHRVLVTEATFAMAYLVAAIAIALLAHSSLRLSAGALVATFVAFIAARHVTFPVGSAWTRPTQVVFVPMLFLLPLSLVPLVVLGCKLLDMLPELVRRSVSPTRILARIGDCTFALGPVLVLVHDQRFAWSHVDLYVLALGAQFACDLGCGLARTWFADRILPSQQLPMWWVYMTDASLACVGLLVAAAAVGRPGLVLLTLPLLGLLALFAHERQERLDQTLALSTAYRGTALLLGDVIEGDDEYTGIHSREVVDLALAVADRLSLSPTARRNVEFGGLLHDVGKIRVPNEIIRKPDTLDQAEWAVMRQHTVYGEHMLKQIGGVLSSVGTVVRASHERYDGAGYPDGLSGEQIPMEARIVAACDAFNAMTTNRPYRRALAVADAVDELRRCSGSQFDPVVVSALLEEVATRLESSSEDDTSAASRQAGTSPSRVRRSRTSSSVSAPSR